MTSAPWYRTAVPGELRKILFSKDERPAAVGDYGLRAKIRLPDKTIEDLEVRADPEAMVVLKYGATVPGDGTEVEPSRDQVAAALIRFRSGIKVPLPRSAQKILQPADDGIFLVIDRDWGKGAKSH